MIPNAIARYKAVQINTASPGQVLLMLYDGIFRFLGEAKDALQKDELARFGERVGRTHAILSELVTGLNPTLAPELCQNLENLYFFCMSQLVQANLKKSSKEIDDVLRVLTPLRDAWATAVRSNAQTDAAPAGAP